MRAHLTDRFCATAKADSQVDYFDDTVRGLALRVSSTAKTWTLHYSRPGGKRARLTLGRYPVLSLAAARTRALEAKSAIAEGRDPQPQSTNTLRAVVDEFFRREGEGLRSVNARRSMFDRLVLPVLGDRPIGDVRRSEIVRLVDDISDHRGPRAAGLTLNYLSKVFNWHASRDDDFRSPIVRGMAKQKSKARDRILSDDEIRLVWSAADQAGLFGRYIQFLLLTAVRRNEAAHMTRAEIAGDVWTIPAERMKGKVEHVVPLSAAALSCIQEASAPHAPCVDGQALDMLLIERRRPGPFVFGGHKPIGGFGYFKRTFDEAVPLSKPWTLHDLRRTARSLLSRAQVPADIAERCLAHVIPGIRGVYDRHAYREEKRQAFEALAGLVQRIVDPQPNVVAIKR
jgi:integrase